MIPEFFSNFKPLLVDEQSVALNVQLRTEVNRLVKAVLEWYSANVLKETHCPLGFLTESEIDAQALLDVSGSDAFLQTKELTHYSILGLEREKISIFQHSLTDREIKKIVRVFFETLQHLFPAKFQKLFDETQPATTDEKIEIYSRFIFDQIEEISVGFKKAFPVFLAGLNLPEPMKIFFQSIPALFSSFGPGVEMEQSFRPVLNAAQDFIVQDFNQQTGSSAATLEDVVEIKSEAGIRAFVAKYARQPNFSVHTLQAMVRNASHDSFYHYVKEDIAKGDLDSDLVWIFDRIINDYISLGRSKHWRFAASDNFGYAYRSLEETIEKESLPECKTRVERMKRAHFFMQHLEEVFKGFITFAESLKNLKSALPALLFADRELWNAHMKAHYKSQCDRLEYAVESGLMEALLHHTLKKTPLEAVEKFQFFKFANFMRHHCSKPLDYQPTPEEQQFVELVLENFDEASRSCIEWAHRFTDPEDNKLPVLGIGFSGPSFDPDPNNSRDKVFVSFTHKLIKNDPVPSQAFLLASGLLIEILYRKGEWILESEFGSMNTYETKGLHLHVLREPEEADKQVLNYIGSQIFQTLCQSPQTIHPEILSSYQRNLAEYLKGQVEKLKADLQKIRDMINEKKEAPKTDPALLESWKKRCGEIKALKLESEGQQLDNLKKEEEELQSKIRKANPKKRQEGPNEMLKETLLELEGRVTYILGELKLIQAGSLNLLAQEMKDELALRLKSLESRVCLEAMINHRAGTPYTLSFAMGPTNVPPINYQEEGFTFGPRTLIQPCPQRCQIMSAAHTLWGELNHVSSAQQMDERDRNKGGQGLPSFII
jgi:hypothetical protein